MSERGTIEVAVAEVIEDNNNNNEAAEDAALDQHQRDHSGLLTIGEKCVHLICEFIRTFRVNETSIMGTLFTTSAVTLSRLSRTCRTMYINVRNLPSVLDLPQPKLTVHFLPWGTIGLDLGYWCDIAGLVWEVWSSPQLLSLTAPTTAESSPSCLAGHGVNTNCARLGNLFLHLPDLTDIGALTGPIRTEIVQVLEQCGGLSFSLLGRFNPITSVGLDLRRCRSLRYLHASAGLREDFGNESYGALLEQLAAMKEKPHYSSIAITESCVGILTDLSALSSFHRIRVNAPPDLRSIQGVQQARFVSLYDLCLTDASALVNVHTVELLHCHKITDVSSLGNVHTLCLKDCQGITDVSALSAVKELDIRFCYGVTNLAGLPNLTRDEEAAADLNGDLSNVRSVNLSYRKDVTDVSMLGHVHALNLRRCTALKDVRMLGHVHTLDLCHCEGITDVSMLGNVYSLDLSDCRNITDVSALGHVHTLNLRDCINVSDASMLGGVHTLSLAWCNWLTDVRPLATVHRLNLSHCNGITDVSSLEDVTHLCLNGCENVTNASALINKVPFLEF